MYRASDHDVAKFVIERIADAPADDSANLVERAVPIVRSGAGHSGTLAACRTKRRTRDQAIRTRYFLAALSLGEIKAADQLRISDGDPDGTHAVHPRLSRHGRSTCSTFANRYGRSKTRTFARDCAWRSAASISIHGPTWKKRVGAGSDVALVPRSSGFRHPQRGGLGLATVEAARRRRSNRSRPRPSRSNGSTIIPGTSIAWG